MPLIDLKYSNSPTQSKRGYSLVNATDFAKFGVAALGLGDLTDKARMRRVVAAMFDLEGFTKFCSQSDSQVVVPEYMESFLTWFITELKKESHNKKIKGGVAIYGVLPFFIKFTGDGLLLLFDYEFIQGERGLGYLATGLYNLTWSYENEFLKKISQHFELIPQRLRCGVARGDVVELGGGTDFVGPCINLAARLQKLNGLRFAVSRKGMPPEKCWQVNERKDWLLKRIRLRGYSHDEIVLVDRDDFAGLPVEMRKLFVTSQPDR